jgi:RHS repeat-associated protein
MLVALLAVSLLATTASSARAAGRSDRAGEAPRIGGFGLGDGLEGLIDPRDGALALAIPVAGLSLGWDSHAIGVDEDGLGPAWSWRLDEVDIEGGVRVRTSTGQVRAADASSPSGLLGHDVPDLAFRPEAGVLPERTDGVALDGDTAYAFVLHELGGRTTYYARSGALLAQVSATGERTDWRWTPGAARRLTGTISAGGVVTRLRWSARQVRVRLDPSGVDAAAAAEWVIRFGSVGVVSVTDPVGGVTHVGADAGGLLTSLDAPSGARTLVAWAAPAADAVARVSEIATTDEHGQRLSTRTWATLGGVSATGWPVGDPALGIGVSAGYRTRVGDGATQVTSSYDAHHRLVDRITEVATGSGSARIQEQRFAYPGAGDAASGGAALPDGFGRPSRATVVFRDPRGGSRTVVERYAYDGLGRLVRRTAQDGTTTTTVYDDAQTLADRPPVGAAVEQITVAADGSTSVTRRTLNPERTAVVADERLAGASADALETIARTEFDVRPDGFVTEQRELPSDGGAPRITRWSDETDRARLELTVTETRGAGTAAASTSGRTVSLVHGGVVREVDPLGNATVREFDALGRPTGSADAAGRRTTVQSETAQADGRNAITTTGPDGVAETEVRDALGRVTAVLDNVRDGGVVAGFERVVETREYPDPATVRVTDAWGATSTAREDVLGRPVEAVAPNGTVLRTVYDDVANTVSRGMTPTGLLADAELVETERHDVAGRVAGATGERADGREVPQATAEFDGFGRPTTLRAAGVEVRTGYDPAGKPTETRLTPLADRGDVGVADASIVASRRFDGFGGRLEKTLTDASGSHTGGANEVDALGRVTARADPAGGRTEYSYTADGLVARAIAPSGQITEHAYDPQTRQVVRTTVSSPIGPAVTTAYEYDPATGRRVAVYDPADRAATEVRTTYDAHGGLLATRYPDGRQVSYEYDEHGRREAIRDVGGNLTEFTYDAAGLLHRATLTAPRTDAPAPRERGRELARIEIDHDWMGRPITLARGNGVTTTYTYTSASEIATETTTRGPHPVSSRRYRYDDTGRLIERTDAVGDLDHRTTRYRSDAFGRLTGSSVHAGAAAAAPAVTRTDYTLDVSGNLVGERTTDVGGEALAGPGSPTGERTYGYTPRGELVQLVTRDHRGTVTTTAEYDAAGNLVTAHDGTTYTYDAANRRIGATTAPGLTGETTTSETATIESTTIEYWADGTRRRVATGEQGRSTTFYWSGGELLDEVHEGGGVTTGGAPEASAHLAAYLLAAGRQARTTHAGGDAATAYLGTDRHGSVMELTDEDGGVIERYAYTDWGEPIAGGFLAGAATAVPRAAIGDVHRNAFGFAGEQHDADGLQHLRARDYDPVTRRLITEDPVPRHNAYAYADADPIMRVDPTGRTSSADTLNVGLAVAGAAFAVLGLVVGGVALTPFGIAASVVSLLDTAIAVAEVVNVAAPQVFSRAAATTLAALSAATGALTFAFGVRAAIRSRTTTVAVGLPAPVRDPLGGVAGEEFADPRELADLVTFFRGDHAALQAELMRPMQPLAGLTLFDEARQLARYARGQIGLQGDYAHLARRLMDRPVVSMTGPKGNRVRVTVWDALVAGAPDRLPLPGELVARMRVDAAGFGDFVPAAHRNAEEMVDRLTRARAAFGGDLPAADQVAALRLTGEFRPLSDPERALQRLSKAQVFVEGVRDQLRQVLGEAF